MSAVGGHPVPTASELRPGKRALLVPDADRAAVVWDVQ